MTRAQVVADIDSGTHSYFVRDSINGKRADVKVVREAGTVPYLRTVAAGRPTDNLLSLDQCRSSEDFASLSALACAASLDGTWSL